jgi:hypothetical protein
MSGMTGLLEIFAGFVVAAIVIVGGAVVLAHVPSGLVPWLFAAVVLVATATMGSLIWDGVRRLHA